MEFRSCARTHSEAVLDERVGAPRHKCSGLESVAQSHIGDAFGCATVAPSQISLARHANFIHLGPGRQRLLSLSMASLRTDHDPMTTAVATDPNLFFAPSIRRVGDLPLPPVTELFWA